MSGFQTIEELQTEVSSENIDYSEEDFGNILVTVKEKNGQW